MRRPTTWWIPWAGLLAISPIVVVLERSGQRTLLTVLLVPAILIGLHACGRWAASTRAAFLAFLALATVVFSAGLVAEVRENLSEVREWDFLGFWLHARTAVRGADFYDPSNAAESAAALELSSSFRREIIDTGFWYPPPSMFLFLPLGWFDPHTALVLWYGFNVLVMAIDVLLLWRIFFPRGSLLELAACAALLAAIGGAPWTFYFAQTNFVALLALLLFWSRRRSAWGGVWAVVAMFVKPFLAVLGLCLMIGSIGSRRRALAGLAAALAMLCLASAVVFGPRSFSRYIMAPSAEAKPGWVYSQVTNQSLLGFALRTTKGRCSGIGCLGNPLYLGAAAALTVITIPLGARVARLHTHGHEHDHERTGQDGHERGDERAQQGEQSRPNAPPHAPERENGQARERGSGHTDDHVLRLEKQRKHAHKDEDTDLDAHGHEELTVALFLLLALLVYPVSQVFYSVLLVPLLLLVWRYRDRVIGGAGTIASLAAVVYALSAARDGEMTVGAFAILWAAIALLALALVRGKGWPLKPDPLAAGISEARVS